MKNLGTILIKNKKLPILLIALLLSIAVYAIDTRLSIGVNQSRFAGSDQPGKGTTGLPRFSIGGSLHWPVNSCLTIQNGLELHNPAMSCH